MCWKYDENDNKVTVYQNAYKISCGAFNYMKLHNINIKIAGKLFVILFYNYIAKLLKTWRWPIIRIGYEFWYKINSKLTDQ